MLKIVQLKTPLGLQTFLSLNGALVSLGELADLFASPRKRNPHVLRDPVPLQPPRAFAATSY